MKRTTFGVLRLATDLCRVLSHHVEIMFSYQRFESTLDLRLTVNIHQRPVGRPELVDKV